MAADASGTPSESQSDQDGIERIVDPDDYTIRRRLRQLHDARDAVREVKDEAFRLERAERSIKPQDRDRFVAERIADYIAEVAVVVEQVGSEDLDAFLETEVDSHENNDREHVTLGEIRDQRGLVGNRGVIHFATSMRAWSEVNRVFERIAGAQFESGSLPSESGFNPAMEDV
jgi:hypothetical protein